MSHTFLEKVVQPRTLDALVDSGFVFDLANIQEDWRLLPRYAWGFALAAAAGAVTTLGMLLAALITPCCRTCKLGNGGKRRPRDLGTDAARATYRICCGAWLLVFLIGTLLGSLTMFGLNEELRGQLVGDNSVFDQVGSGIDGVKPFLQSSMVEINTTVYGGAMDAKTEVFTALHDLPSDGLDTIEKAANLTGTVSSIQRLSDNLVSANSTVKEAQLLSQQLRVFSNQFAIDLDLIRSEIEAAINSCVVPTCTNAKAEVSRLGTVIDFVPIQFNISIISLAIDNALDSGITDEVRRLNSTLSNVTDDVITDMTSQIDDAERDVNDILDTDLLSQINQVGNTINDLDLQSAKDIFRDAKDTLVDTRAGEYTYLGVIVLASIPCVVVVLAVVGVFHGFCQPRGVNGRVCCKSDRASGSDWLFSAIGFTFIFYWLLMLLTLVLFVGGGVVHTEACRYIVHYDDPDYQRAVHTLENVTYQYLPDDVTHYNISVISAYNSCRYDETLYRALRLEHNGFDLHQLLDLSSVKSAIDDVKNTPINFPSDTQLLTSGFNSTLYGLDSAFASVDVDRMLAELGRNVTHPADLDTFANQLDGLSGEPGVNTTDLAIALTSLRLQAPLVQTAEDDKARLYAHVLHVDHVIGRTDFSGLSDSLMTSQVFVNGQGKNVLSGVVNDTADDAYGLLETYISDTIDAVENDVTRCYPLYQSVSTVTTAVCVAGLYQINGLAFALGATMFFLFLSLILSFKLADHYRRPVAWEVDHFPDDDAQEVDATDDVTYRRNLEHQPIHYRPGPNYGATFKFLDSGHHAPVNPAFEPDSVPPLPGAKRIAVAPAVDPRDNITPPPSYQVSVLQNPPHKRMVGIGQNRDDSLLLKLA